MFTITVKEGNNTEVIFEASQVRKCPFPRPTVAGEFPADKNFWGEVCFDVEDGQIRYNIRHAASANPEEDTTIYVMNRFGATVAKYYL